MNKIILCVLFSCWIVQGFSQSSDKHLSKAEAFYATRQYAKAIPEFEKYLHKRNRDTAWVKLSDCYRRINDLDKAAKALNNYLSRRSSVDTLNLVYAEIVKANGNFTAAKSQYEKLYKKFPLQEEYHVYMNYCDSALSWMNNRSDVSEVINLEKINTEYSEIAPVKYQNALVFSSNREGTIIRKKTPGTNLPLYDLWIADGKDSLNPDQVRNFSSKLNTIHHECCASFTSDYKKIFYTKSIDRQNSQDGKNTLKMYSASKGSNEWEDIHTFIFNDTIHSYGHPTVEGEEQLFFFSSDCLGGYGGTDIYVCFNIDGKWTNPINLGPNVNTPFNELYPFYHPDGTLFFSSCKPEGMGGYDIYKAVENENGDFDFVENLKYPINSTANDISFYLNAVKKTGYFSSDRRGGKGNEDIYLIKYK